MVLISAEKFENVSDFYAKKEIGHAMADAAGRSGLGANAGG